MHEGLQACTGDCEHARGIAIMHNGLRTRMRDCKHARGIASMYGGLHSYSPEVLGCLPFHSHVTAVKGNTHTLDRSGKRVILDDGTSLLYDFLVLCTGQQLQVPCPTEADMSQHPTNSEVPNTPDRCYTGIVPPNLFVLNDKEDCRLAHTWLQQNFLSGTGNAVVYGNRLEAHTIIQALLLLGISGSRLHLVEPPVRVGPSCFNNFAIEEAVRAALLQAGVVVHWACLLAHWHDGKESQPGDLITSVSFTTDTKALSLPCDVLFCCYRRTLDQSTFQALNDAGLVYNGGLVVDNCFRTNDPAVWAAGPLTTYARRYHAGQWNHRCYSSRELGFQLATTLLPLLDPTLELPEDLSPEMDCLLPVYSAPKVKGGVLPGGFHYLHIAKPGINTCLEAQMHLPDYGQELVTGSASEGNYFRMHINQYGMVETITCLSKEELPVGNFLSLYGCHERLLNNLSSRFHEGIIPDLYRFFKQSWCLAIFNDRFQHLSQELRRLASTRLFDDSESLQEMAVQLIDGDLVASEGSRDFLEAAAQELGYKKEMDFRILTFLSNNNYHLPMYAQPPLPKAHSLYSPP
uniref:cilia- and flagella-associated protein 61 n=1 Tax=Myxine glutinosa TaxID=7769 RepID=UPI00358F2852